MEFTNFCLAVLVSNFDVVPWSSLTCELVYLAVLVEKDISPWSSPTGVCECHGVAGNVAYNMHFCEQNSDFLK